jgi:hypothetical protein
MFLSNKSMNAREGGVDPLYELEGGPPPPVPSFDELPLWGREVFAMNASRTVYLYAVYLAWCMVLLLSRYDPEFMPLTEPLLFVGGPPGSGKTVQKDEFCYRSGVVPFHFEASRFEDYRAGEPVKRFRAAINEARDIWFEQGKMSLFIVDGLEKAVSIREGYISGTTHTNQMVSAILETCDFARQQQPEAPVPALLFFANNITHVDPAIYRGGRCAYVEWDISGRDCMPAAERMLNGAVDRDSLEEVAEAHPDWRLADFAQVRSHLLRRKVFERYQNTSLNDLAEHLAGAWDKRGGEPQRETFDHEALANAVQCVEQEKNGKQRLGGVDHG